MPNLFQNIGNVIGGTAKGIGDIAGGTLQHFGTGLKAVRDAERARLAQPTLLNRQRLLDQLAQQLEMIKKEGIDPVTGTPMTEVGKAILQEAMKNPLMQMLNQNYQSSKMPLLGDTQQQLSPGSAAYDRISGRALAISKALTDIDPESPQYKNLKTERDLLQDQIAAAHGKQISKKAIPETTRVTYPFGQDWLWPRKTTIPARTQITWEDFATPVRKPATQQENLMDLVTEPNAPSIATNTLLRQQPASTRKAVSDASAVGLNQQQVSQITTNFGTDALEALAGANEAQRKTILAVMQAYQKRGAISPQIRTRVRKMLGLR